MNRTEPAGTRHFDGKHMVCLAKPLRSGLIDAAVVSRRLDDHP